MHAGMVQTQKNPPTPKGRRAMVRRADHPSTPGDNRGNGVRSRSGPVRPVVVSLRQHVRLVKPAAQILLGLPVAGHPALVALAVGGGLAFLGAWLAPGFWPGPRAGRHCGHTSTSALCRAAQAL